MGSKTCGVESGADRLISYRDYVNPYWLECLDSIGMPRTFPRSEGVWLYDEEGKRYLDFVAGFGACVLGHNHNGLLSRIEQSLHCPAPIIATFSAQEEAGSLAQRLIQLAGGTLRKVHFANSGAEAIESAMKFSALVTKRNQFIGVDGGFHGLTIAATALAGGGPWRDGLPYLGPECRFIPCGNLDALSKELSRNCYAAFVLEVIQGLGVSEWSSEQLNEISLMCKESGTLLIIDEVLTGLGRVGGWFAFSDAVNLCPDMVVISKGLTGGVIPVSAVLLTNEVHEIVFSGPGRAKIQGSTFSGNRLALECANAVIDILETQMIVDNVPELSLRLRSGLKQFGSTVHTLGRGLLLGIEIRSPSQSLSSREAGFRCWAGLLRRGVITSFAGHAAGVLRVTPPLNLTTDDVDFFLDAIDDVIHDSDTWLGDLK